MNRRRPRSPDQPRGELSKRRKFVACQRCHAHKIKCSGDQPCAKCRQVGCADECEYAARDRQIKVNQSFLDELVAENRRLKAQSASASRAEADREQAENGPARPTDATDGPDEGNTSVRNPLIGDRAWFHRYDPSAPPLYVGEAACTAFATRFRRFLTGNNATAHIPRTQYVKDESITAANTANVQWPSLQQARLLVKIAMRQVCHMYHLVMRKSTLEKLEDIYRTGNFECTVNKCKFFALFAFGEAYSMRAEPSTGSRVPGTAYFARALSLVQVPPERTNITHLETLLLLSLFSYYLNRRHSALVLVGTAMRLGLSIGMNHNIPETQLIDPVERQHRLRIWWTIYVFDRTWGSKMGQPSQILDDDIHLDMPSSISPVQLHNEQFSDTDHLTANIELARIVGDTIAKLYSRRKYSETFLQRVQKLLKALKHWVETLPEHLRLNEDDLEVNRKSISSLHLSFNQCVILTTRPTLLHLLINNRTTDISQPVLTLGEACIHAARHSYSVILTKWINGSLPVFGYFHAHYLFSLALVLAMASFLPIGSPSDLGAFETSLEMMRSMSENGNLAAAEFHMNLVQVKECLGRYREANPSSSSSATSNIDSTIPPVESTPIPLVTTSTATAAAVPNNTSILTPEDEPLGLSGYALPATAAGNGTTAVPGFTTAMAFMEPTMQDFLAQSDFDLGLLHPVDTFMSEESFFTSQGI
ncbi:fungal-specific transcription factor [Aspergillus steynii IBT 23096]|uniref:Fungal-specific transcription factor n=1 Tax=Aspergillus steynii IBT 23096 TaxID=1392250 RepID=A0A2I2GBV9_9EURO|nr:fungal-specific transcription factor [Aspergillus steynii IBT 23096]PLB50374.1 fungal-specific transcription factor [Aspergillus steynii IBT 23096]